MVQVGPATEVGFPAGMAAIADLAPVDDAAGTGWLVLDAAGVISRWDLAAGTCRALVTASVPGEPHGWTATPGNPRTAPPRSLSAGWRTELPVDPGTSHAVNGGADAEDPGVAGPAVDPPISGTMDDPLGRNSTAEPEATLAAITSKTVIAARMTQGSPPGNWISDAPQLASVAVRCP